MNTDRLIPDFLDFVEKNAPYMANKGVEIGCEHYADKLSLDAAVGGVLMYVATILNSTTATEQEIEIYMKKVLARVADLALYLEFSTSKREGAASNENADNQRSERAYCH